MCPVTNWRSILSSPQNYVHVHPPQKHLYNTIKTKTINLWKTRWKRETTCRQTRLMLPKPNSIFTKHLFTLSRGELSMLLQFVTGHNYLRYHLYNTGRADNPMCRLCHEEKETAWHIMAECPRLFFVRAEHLCAMELDHMPHPRALLNFLKSPTINPLLTIPNT